MKRRNGITQSIAMVIITLGMLFTFNEKISSKPTEAGFWLIFVFGMSAGVAIVHIITYYRQKRKE
ncbi:MAG: hypothetical protein PHD06_09365 [Bacteroidales bacterium]|jgi:Na+-transporting NADH:ubiquinone oxidoreductase subunit NqrB|nr:hypothetical protein [Bacteroidales bacterium]MDD4385371.1 hypothetical protein [Bacteroidales bacterium]MDY0196792.1 hypothetical protein [Tenuifilaceae bacterium]